MNEQESSSVQATLRRVIELGYYGSDVYDEGRRMYLRQHYMCCALTSAHTSGEISADECTSAILAVAAYLGRESGSMYQRLRQAGLVPAIGAGAFADTIGRQLYWDWDKRPSLD